MKSICICFLMIIFFSSTVRAEDSKFMGFLLKTVHEKDFKKCDNAFRDAFEYIAGEDIRIISMSGLHEDSIRLLVAYGYSSDAVYQEAVIRHVGSECTYTTSITVSYNRTCAAALKELSSFEFEAKTVGVIFAKNPGGVNVALIPVGDSGCTYIFSKDGRK